MYHNMYDVRADILIERQQWANSGSTYMVRMYIQRVRGVRMYIQAGGASTYVPYVCTGGWSVATASYVVHFV